MPCKIRYSHPAAPMFNGIYSGVVVVKRSCFSHLTQIQSQLDPIKSG